MRTFLPLVLVCCLPLLTAAEGAKAGFPDLMGKAVALTLSEKGRPVDRIDATFADGKMASPWLARHGFPSPIDVPAPTHDGKINKRTNYTINVTSAKGDTLTATITFLDSRGGGGISGQLSLVRADGTARTFGVAADKTAIKVQPAR